MYGETGPKVVVIGAGAMGSVFGGLLAEGGLDVTLVDVWRDHVDAINARGLVMCGHGGERAIKVAATTEIASVTGADVVLFQCKATANAAAAGSARHLFTDGATAISFQNGLGNEEEIGGILGEGTVLAGLTAQAAMLEGPGRVRNFSDLPSYIGEPAGGVSARVEAIAERFSAAGLQTVPSASIMREKWGKLLVNIAFAGTSGMTGLTLGGVIAHPQLSHVARAAMEEAAAVAASDGIHLDPAERNAVFDKIMQADAANNKASLLADLAAGRPTEVDYIYGTAIRIGERNGVPVPTLKLLSALIKGKEAANASA